jgi:4-carboxymuconolactone decarboxylase
MAIQPKAESSYRVNQLLPAPPELLPLNEAAEAQRAATVLENFGLVAPGVVQYTTDLLFRELWLRPALAPRDRRRVAPPRIGFNSRYGEA